MADALKLEARIPLFMWCECFFRWEHKSRARMAARTTPGICSKTSRQKKGQVSFQAPNNRGRLPSSLDFGSRFSFEKKFADSNFGSGDQKSGSTIVSLRSETCFFIPETSVSHAHTICCCFPGRVRFGSFPAQPEFYRYVSFFFLSSAIWMDQKYMRDNVCRYVEYHGIDKLFELYQEDVLKAKFDILSKGYFYTLWRRVMNDGVYDPGTGIKYITHVRFNHCRGFAQCTTCEILAADLARAANKDERESFARALAEHRAEVNTQRLRVIVRTRLPCYIGV